GASMKPMRASSRRRTAAVATSAGMIRTKCGTPSVAMTMCDVWSPTWTIATVSPASAMRLATRANPNGTRSTAWVLSFARPVVVGETPGAGRRPLREGGRARRAGERRLPPPYLDGAHTLFCYLETDQCRCHVYLSPARSETEQADVPGAERLPRKDSDPCS